MAKKSLKLGIVNKLEADSEAPPAAGAEPVVRRARLLYEGAHDGSTGPVEVSRELIELMAERYNKAKASPQNEHDFAPVLVDHEWKTDQIKGRLLAGLAVGTWLEPVSEKEVATLEGELRIDDAEAQGKVAEGKYNHVSLTFDDETGEIFEVSFVAVEAARGAQLLSKGDNKMDFEKKYKALSKRVKESRTVRGASLSALSQNLKQTDTDAGAINGAIGKVMLAVRTAGLKGQFRGLVRLGKISKAEFDALKFGELASLSAEGLKAVLAAYDSRPVNGDFIQHGQAGAQPIPAASSSPAAMRELIKLQKAGKKASLAAEEGKEDEEKENKESLSAEGEEGDEQKKKEEAAPSELKLDDMEEVLKALEGVGPMIDKVLGYVKQMNGQVDQLSAEQEKDKTDSEGDEQ